MTLLMYPQINVEKASSGMTDDASGRRFVLSACASLHELVVLQRDPTHLNQTKEETHMIYKYTAGAEYTSQEERAE